MRTPAELARLASCTAPTEFEDIYDAALAAANAEGRRAGIHEAALVVDAMPRPVFADEVAARIRALLTPAPGEQAS
jgi:hypothetical protein